MGDSPAKKLDFVTTDKENLPFDATVPTIDDVVEVTDIQSQKVDVERKPLTIAETIKEMEADEPLLQPNPNRFVLFPLKYHEVSRVDALNEKYNGSADTFDRSGKCIRRLKPLSGQLKRLTCPRIYTTGTIN